MTTKLDEIKARCERATYDDWEHAPDDIRLLIRALELAAEEHSKLLWSAHSYIFSHDEEPDALLADWLERAAKDAQP